jgi:hypothetical protein
MRAARSLASAALAVITGCAGAGQVGAHDRDADSDAVADTGATDGRVQNVSATPVACPGITSFSISPAEVIGQQTSQLAVVEIGPCGLARDGGPLDGGATNVLWTAGCSPDAGLLVCGTFDGQPTSTAPAPLFQCSGTIAYDALITVRVTNYEVVETPAGEVIADVCLGVPYTSMSATIHCEGSGPLQH